MHLFSLGLEGLGHLRLWIRLNSKLYNSLIFFSAIPDLKICFWILVQCGIEVEVWWMLMTLSSTTTTKVCFKYQVSLWRSFCGKKSSEIRFLQTQNVVKRQMVFCYHNCSNVLWEKIVLVWGKKSESRK